jgi:lipopolysaccharide/colanic/teichoic acid biosynthesis glycosyltransferase
MYRNSIDWNKKIEIDIKYITNFRKIGIFYDFWILFLTISSVLSPKNIFENP